MAIIISHCPSGRQVYIMRLFINLTPLILPHEIRISRGPLNPPLHNRDMYSLHEGEETLERGEYGVPTKTKFLWGKNPLSYLHSPFP
jgi:hypothetical protein